MASKKKSDFGVMSQEPCGTTFEDCSFPKLAGESNKKRKGMFGIMSEEPTGLTVIKSKFPMPLPDASKAPLRGIKTIAETSGQGSYSPKKSGPENFGGSESVGGTMKSGKMDRKSQRFT